MSADPIITVSVNLPRAQSAGLDEFELADRLRALWAVELVRLKRIGVGKGSEMAGMPRAAFMRFLGEHGVPCIDYPLDDLRDEIARIRAQ